MIQARKRFGQNFLIDQGLIQRIIRAIGINPKQRVIEIGPGQGALTKHLVDLTEELSVIEIDRDLVTLLQTQYPSLDVICEDVLKANLADLLRNKPARIIGNLPYNISTPLLFRLFQHASQIEDMHFMLQLEVVDRMTASPSTKAYGRLSVMTQLYCRAEKLFEVPPEAFSPRPKIMSAIVRLTPEPAVGRINHERVEQLLIQAFSARRKTVRNALKGLVSEAELLSLGIRPDLRPENLSVNDYIACANLPVSGS